MGMSENFNCSISKRGKKQIEIRTNYSLKKTKRKKQKFCLNAYIYTPAQLGIRNERYSKETFFNNFVSNTRYKTPEIELSQIISPEFELSPVLRLESIFKKENFKKIKDSFILYELKTLLNIVQNQLRSGSDKLIRGIDSRKYSEQFILNTGEVLFNNVEAIHKSIRNMVKRTEESAFSDMVKQSFLWLDEGMSIRIEKSAGRIYNSLSCEKLLPDFCKSLIEIIRKQVDYRINSGYGTRVSRSNPAITEYMLYRENEIKKWAESSMYMSKNETNTVNNLVQIMFGAAAAVAMSVAVFASIISLKWFDSGSIYWAIIAVIAYILKDRIKEGLRVFFARFIPRFIADKVQIVIDPRTGKKCGKTKERILHKTKDSVPGATQKLRLKNKDVLLKKLVAEDIIQYQKNIVIDSNDLLGKHKRLESINEIMRLDMRHWFYRMDRDREFRFHLEGDTLETVRTERVYHFTVILGMSEVYSGMEEELKRYRIIANSNGIRRIDEVD